MTTLRRQVSRNQIVTHGRTNAVRNQCSRARDESVKHDDPTCLRSAQDDADQHTNLKSPDFGEYVEAVGSVRSVGRQRPFDHCDFALELFVVAAGSASRHVSRRHPSDRRGDGRSRGRIADAHVSGSDQVRSGLSRFKGERHASPNASLRLLARHGGTTRHVLRASTDRNNPQPRMVRQRRCDPGINDCQIDACHARHHIDRRAVLRGSSSPSEQSLPADIR